VGLWDDLEKFLEARLEQFLQANPQIQVYVLLEQIQLEETQAKHRLVNLRDEEKELYAQILDTAQQIQKWAARRQKAQIAGRNDLAQAAKDQESALLTKGNQLWSRKNEVLSQLKATEDLLQKLVPRRQELEAKVRQSNEPKQPRANPSTQEVDALFERWEIDQALEDLKRKMGR